MTLMRFDPFRELDRLTERTISQAARTMPMEALRRGDEFAVYLDLPGVNPDDVDVTVENNVVSIRARRMPQREEGDEVIADERTYGEFTRQLFLGDNLDPNGLTADLANGVLTLRIPVSEASKPRRVALASSERDGDSTERSDAPAERSDAPAERSDAPAERSDAPAERSDAPAGAASSSR